MNAYVSPEPSLRNIGVIFMFGRWTPLLSLLIAGLFHVVI